MSRATLGALCASFAARLLALLVAVACASAPTAGCSGTLRDRAWDVSNAVAEAANAGGDVFIAAVCVQQMRAIGRVGRLEGERCVESGPRAGTAATPAEREALATLRVTHAAIVAAYQRVRQAHAVLMGVLRANDDRNGARMFDAVAHLTAAYAELVSLGAAAGIRVPDLLSNASAAGGSQ